MAAPMEPVRPRDDPASGPPGVEGDEAGGSGGSDVDEDMAEEFRFDDIFGDGTGDMATPVPESPEDAAPGDDLRCEPCDARVPIMLRSPVEPSKEDIEAHYATHCPYRNWCPVCVKAAGKEDPHYRDEKREPGLPVVSMDYNELDDEKGSKSNKVIVVKDEDSGATLQHKVTNKGASDEWVNRKIVRDIEEWGGTDIKLKTDGEPAIVALQSKVQATRKSRTVPVNPPAYNPQSNGACEKGVQDVTGQTRKLKISLESRTGMVIDDSMKIMEWIYPHAAYVLTRFSLGHDGMTAWERLTGSKWTRPMMEIGETVLAKLATRRIGKGRAKRQKKKLQDGSDGTNRPDGGACGHCPEWRCSEVQNGQTGAGGGPMATGPHTWHQGHATCAGALPEGA